MANALFILGMHRSGTSALARVVNLLGADLGTHLMAAAEDNQRGFFEHETIVSIHEKLLTELGLSWQDGIPLPEGWLQSEAAKSARSALAEIIDQDFTSTPLWALKDPRQCRLMPLWMPLLEERAINPHFIITWRHPLEVAASLNKRDGIARDSALLCWLSYTLEALLAAQDHPTTIVSYDGLLSNWQDCLNQTAEDLELDWPTPPKQAAEEINNFLSPQLRHHKMDESNLPKAIEACLKLLQKPDSKKLITLLKDRDDQCAALGPLLRETRLNGFFLTQELEKTKKEAASAEHRAQDLEQQFVSLQLRLQEVEQEALRRETLLKEQLEAVYSSSSWKLTEPMRKLSATVGGRKKLAESDETQ